MSRTPSASLDVRLYQPGDEAAIVALYNAVFSEAITLERWRWKYAQNPTGPPLIALGWQEGRLAVNVCASPIRFWVNRQEALAAHWSDMIVAPEHTQGLGGARLMMQTGKTWLARYAASGAVDFGYGLPVPRFKELSKKIWDYAEVAPAPQLARLLRPAYALRRWLAGRPRLQAALLRARLLPAPRYPRLQESAPLSRIYTFDARFDRLWADLAARFAISAVRDARHLNWRYAPPEYVKFAAASPAQAEGYVVCRLLQQDGWRVGVIADLLARDEAAARQLLSAALAYFHRAGASLARAWRMPHDLHYPAFRRAGFLPRLAQFSLLAGGYTGRAPTSLLARAASWSLSYGDSDGV
ncbi:MAG: hypothetical protein L0Z70_04090 [Chloroflexi bacterium]|nr:hypothetical protein [Chloroflexota bacterium]